jgi:hypothetical protein
MKASAAVCVYELPASELEVRVERARDLLREAQVRLDHSRNLRVVHEVYDALERLVPGFLAPPRAVLARTLSDLAPPERRVLRRAIATERAARERLQHLLGDLSPSVVEDVLARVETCESIAAELHRLLRSFDRAREVPVLA